MNLRQILINAARSHYAGHINKHIANIEVLLNNPAGIGEHQDIQESIEIELGHIADYHDKMEMLTKFFITKKGEENAEHTEEK
tara:strand:- start:305 stop:553 length:249 start_codon:yes stop_codon:yes gene_type:complete